MHRTAGNDHGYVLQDIESWRSSISNRFLHAIFWFTLVCVPHSYLDVSENKYFIHLALALHCIGPQKLKNSICCWRQPFYSGSQNLCTSFYLMRLLKREQSNVHRSTMYDQSQNSNCEYWIISYFFLADGKKSDSKPEVGGS